LKTLITNGYIVTVDQNDAIYPEGALIMDGECISWVGHIDALPQPMEAFDEVIDAEGNLVIPGLINAHTHNAYYLMRGMGMDRELKAWLIQAIWPGLIEIQPDDAYIAALAGCLENIKSGVTCLVDNYYMPRYKKGNIDHLLQGMMDSGIKGAIARGYHDIPFNVPEDFMEGEDEVLAEYRRIIEKWHGAGNGRLAVWVSPVNLVYSSASSVQKVWQLARHYGVGMHTHVAEARFEVEKIKERYGMTIVEAFTSLGVMGKDFHAVHAVHLSSREIDILRDHGATAVFNPASNLLLASGIAPIEEMLQKGLRVTLGTDAPNNNQDMIESMKFATILPRVINYNPVAVTSYQTLKMATIQGAESLNIQAQTGSLEVGKKADITIVNMHSLHNTPVHDPVINLVYSANQSDVTTVFVNGKKLLDGGKLLHVSEHTVVADMQVAAEGLAKRIQKRSQ
jgi:5-methylthioadenosine/S-adenosylhomocysteine deaminase